MEPELESKLELLLEPELEPLLVSELESGPLQSIRAEPHCPLRAVDCRGPKVSMAPIESRKVYPESSD